MLTIKKLLSFNTAGVDFEKEKVKLVRHKHDASGFDFYNLYRTNNEVFCLYQNFQGKNVFDNCKYLISFVGTNNTYAKFIGVYKVLGRFDARDYLHKLKPYSEFQNLFEGSKCYYQLEELDGFDEFKNRAVINWGSAARSWVQNGDKDVTEILPKGFVKDFPGFLEFTLDYDELKEVINNPESNREWKTLLSSVAGVYLILDQKTGYQYIGSAYGVGGIWNRWIQYIQNKHGGNKELINLLKKDPNRYKKFQFTILQTLPKTLTEKEVIDYENKYKHKLGSRVFGLNCN